VFIAGIPSGGSGANFGRHEYEGMARLVTLDGMRFVPRWDCARRRLHDRNQQTELEVPTNTYETAGNLVVLGRGLLACQISPGFEFSLLRISAAWLYTDAGNSAVAGYTWSEQCVTELIRSNYQRGRSLRPLRASATSLSPTMSKPVLVSYVRAVARSAYIRSDAQIDIPPDHRLDTRRRVRAPWVRWRCHCMGPGSPHIYGMYVDFYISTRIHMVC
jgi:hypothetical protein